MPGVMEDGDAVLVLVQDFENMLRSDAVTFHQFTQTVSLCLFEYTAQTRCLLTQIAQILARLLAVVGKS